MTELEKIKNMNSTEMAEFLSKEIISIAIDKVCSNLCIHSDATGRCTVVEGHGCLMSNYAIIKMWLESEVEPNES